MRATFALAVLSLASMLGGCAVVKASADVAGAAGRLGGTIVSTTAGAIGDAASTGSGKSGKKGASCPDGTSDNCGGQSSSQ